MKKNLLYLFTLLCTLSFFTACGDDKEDDPTPTVDESWKELSATYKTDKLSVSINESPLVSVDGRTAVVDATSAEAASVVLNNVVPDDKAVTITAKLTKANDIYSLSGEQTINGATITANGTFEKGVLKLAITRKMSTELTGTWNMLFTQPQGMPITIGSVYMNFKGENEAMDAQVNAGIPMLVGMKLAEKVSAVSVDLKENGTMDAGWTKVDGTKATVSQVSMGMAQMYYVVKNNQLLVGIDKGLLENAMLIGILTPILEQKGIELQKILALMEDMGGFYGVPVSYNKGDATTVFYADTQLAMKAMGAFGGMMTGLMTGLATTLPPDQLQLLNYIMTTLSTGKAEKAEIGLIFTK